MSIWAVFFWLMAAICAVAGDPDIHCLAFVIAGYLAQINNRLAERDE